MPFDAKRSELTELLSRLCDGEIEPAERERLETLLLDDAAAQDLYRRFIALDVELACAGPVVRRPHSSTPQLPPRCRRLSRLRPLYPPRLRRSIRLAASYSPMRRPW